MVVGDKKGLASEVRYVVKREEASDDGKVEDGRKGGWEDHVKERERERSCATMRFWSGQERETTARLHYLPCARLSICPSASLLRLYKQHNIKLCE